MNKNLEVQRFFCVVFKSSYPGHDYFDGKFSYFIGNDEETRALSHGFYSSDLNGILNIVAYFGKGLKQHGIVMEEPRTFAKPHPRRSIPNFVDMPIEKDDFSNFISEYRKRLLSEEPPEDFGVFLWGKA
jgi:hypothetical protein